MVIVARGEPLDVTVFLKNDSTVVRTEQLRIYQVSYRNCDHIYVCVHVYTGT